MPKSTTKSKKKTTTAETPEPESFEVAMEELESIVEELESSQMALDELVSSYERGTGLLRFCQERISNARQRVETITVSGENPSDTANVSDFDPEPAAPAPGPSSTSPSSAQPPHAASGGGKGNSAPKTSPTINDDDNVRLF